MLKYTLVIDSAGSLYAVGDAPVEALQTPVRKSYADYRYFERASLHHRIQCREDHFVGEIACDTEDDQRV
jgi:hypothetical protein